jgi:type IV secretion system protein VirD4
MAITPEDLMHAEPCGVFFGAREDKRNGWRYVGKPEHFDGHVLISGGVGSGKSSCIAIPTLLSWRERVFAIDIKGELYAKSKKYRPNAKIFDPFSTVSYGYNPFYLLERSDNPAQEAREIAIALIHLPPETRDPFWIESARNVLTGAILHFHHLGYSFIQTIHAILDMATEELVEEIARSGAGAARRYINSYVKAPEKTISGIMLELHKSIVCFGTDRRLISCFSRPNNITPADLDKGFDVFIQIPEKLLTQWDGLLRLIVSQFLTYFEGRADEISTPILFLLDEFPRLGKVDRITDALATLRSKSITICIIVQSLAQLDQRYGEKERAVIADTCAYKAVLNALDPNTQDYFSRLVGTYDRTVHSSNVHYHPFVRIQAGTGKGTSTTESRIIKPEEFSTLQDIVFFAPCGFTRVRKVHYSEI